VPEAGFVAVFMIGVVAFEALELFAVSIARLPFSASAAVVVARVGALAPVVTVHGWPVQVLPVVPKVSAKIGSCSTVSVSVVTAPQWPRLSRARTWIVFDPRIRPVTAPVRVAVCAPVGVAVIAWPLPAPGSAPTNHSAPLTAARLSVAAPVTVPAPVPVWAKARPLTTGPVLSTDSVVVANGPQFPAASLPRIHTVNVPVGYAVSSLSGIRP